MAELIQPPADPFAALIPPADAPFDHRRLCHLLRRAALGISADRLREFAGRSPVQIVDALTSYDGNDDRSYAEMMRGLSGALSVIHSADEAQRWWIFRMLDTPRPLQERMALFWHIHFATSTGKVKQSALVSRQIDIFRRLGLGSFRDLLLAVTKDAAMLLWLDGSNNKRGRPNENYAREVMELFTLGIGHYGEKDVQELARAFTGGKVKAGIFGKMPSLTDLDDGDLKFTTDFRRVYATILDKWLNAESGKVLGGKYEAVGFL